MFIIRSLFFSYHAKLYYLMGSVRASIAWNLPRKSKTQRPILRELGPDTYQYACEQNIMSLVWASTLDALNVPNIKYLVYLTYQIPKKYQILDVPNLIIFTTYYSILTYLVRYEHLWHMILLFFYSSFSLIPIISFVFSFSYSPSLAIRMCLLLSLFFFKVIGSKVFFFLKVTGSKFFIFYF